MNRRANPDNLCSAKGVCAAGRNSHLNFPGMAERWLMPEEENAIAIPKRGLILRIALAALALTLWFWTQSLIGARPVPASGIGDALHQLTAPLNSYFLGHARAADALLIVSSAIIDALALFLILRWILGRTVRPFLGLLLIIGLRQVMQALSAMPVPPNMIWHYPGFPSLLATYGVGSDFFFSGHTALSVFAATEFARFRKPWLTVFAIALVLFEIATVLILRAHYTVDVFTGALAALWAAPLAERLSPRLDHFLFP